MVKVDNKKDLVVAIKHKEEYIAIKKSIVKDKWRSSLEGKIIDVIVPYVTGPAVLPLPSPRMSIEEKLKDYSIETETEDEVIIKRKNKK